MDIFNLIIGIVGSIFGIIGVIIAVYQNRQRKKIEDIKRTQSWYQYHNTNYFLGSVQKIRDLNKSKYGVNRDIELSEEIARSEMLGIGLLKESIRQIQLSEPSFNVKIIEEWIKNNKIKNDHKDLFLDLVIK